MTVKKIVELLNAMTIEEKIGQLQQVNGGFFQVDDHQIVGANPKKELTEKELFNIGSVIGVSGVKNVVRIQKDYLKKNRLKIPLMFMGDVIHGCKTIFPIPLAMGCSWNPALVEKAASIAAEEAAASGLQVTFSPMADLVRDPRWGRVMESTGEDPFLNGIFAEHMVKGYQGDSLRKGNKTLASCVKHFAAYGAPEGGKEYNTVDMSLLRFYEDYLPAYTKAIQANAKMVMTAFNSLFGQPATANKFLMREILRNQQRFGGVVISDAVAVSGLIPHGVAGNEEEAARLSLNAGVDIEMMSFCYQRSLKNLIESGKVDSSLLDEAVLRILQLKEDLGLFADPYRGISEEIEMKAALTKENRSTALQLAEESTVLLKNTVGGLPLKSYEKIALIGPAANSEKLLGNWSWKGYEERIKTLYEAMTDEFPNVHYRKGCDYDAASEAGLMEEEEIAAASDKIVLVLGRSPEESGEATSLTSLELPKGQQELLKRMIGLHKPIILLLMDGRPLHLTKVIDEVNALLYVWFPGSEGARAVAELLSGKRNPSGKLTMTFPRNEGQIPSYYNYLPTSRPIHQDDPNDKYVTRYIDCEVSPLFPFGYGLSYSSFKIEDLQIKNSVVNEAQPLSATVKIKNISEIAGKTVIQWYVRDHVGEVIRPVKELKGFEKILLGPNEEREITFTLPVADLKYYHADLAYSVEDGAYTLFAGLDSKETLSIPFSLKRKI